jgi:hypothetical protein
MCLTIRDSSKLTPTDDYEQMSYKRSIEEILLPILSESEMDNEDQKNQADEDKLEFKEEEQPSRDQY